MHQSSNRPAAAQFGPFSLSFHDRQLSKGTTQLRLPEQALSILEMLVREPGRIFTRDEIQAEVWGENPPFDREHALNVIMNRLRLALRDSARSSRYIETIPRVGYRFTGFVTFTDGAGAPVKNEEAVLQTELLAAQTEFVPAVGTEPPAGNIEPAVGTGLRNAGPWWKAAILKKAGRWGLPFALGVVSFGIWHFLGRRPEVSLPQSVVPILSLPGDKGYPAISPDDKYVAFAWVGPGNPKSPQRDIYLKLLKTGEPLRLTSNPADELAPVWSPDGSTIAFLREEASVKGNFHWGVYTIDALGGQERHICAAGPGLSWSPDGKKLVISSLPDSNGRNHLVQVDLASGAQEELTPPGPWSDSFPVYSPDGKKIAFHRSFTRSAREAMVMPANGGEPVRLTFDKRPVYGVTWAPDSGSIVYSANRGAGDTLWQLPANGGQPSRVSTSNAAQQPSMSATGKLVYRESYTDSNLYVYEGPGWNNAVRVAESSREEHSPRLSPDGEHLVFVSRRTGNEELWTAPRRGGRPLQLTAMNGPDTGSPRWSPDGKWIVFDSRAGGSADIWIIGADGLNLRQLTSEKSEEMLPAWSADGRWIYFCSDRSARRQIWKMRADGGPAMQMSRDGGLEGYETPDGKFFYFTRDFFETGIRRVPAQGGEEHPVPGLEGAGRWRSWGVNGVGVFYFAPPSPGETLYSVRLLGFHDGKEVRLLSSSEPPPRYQSGLASSHDGKVLVLSKTDHIVNDLFLVEFSQR